MQNYDFDPFATRPMQMGAYQPQQGMWQPGGGGDYYHGVGPQGSWIANPNVNYGQAPQGYQNAMFDQGTGTFNGWGNGNNGFVGIDPTTGQLQAQQQWTTAPDWMQNKVSPLIKYGVLGGLAAMSGGAALSALGPAAAAGAGAGAGGMTAAEAAALGAEAIYGGGGSLLGGGSALSAGELAGALGAAGGAGGFGGAGEAALGGFGGVEPISYSGMQGGIGSYGGAAELGGIGSGAAGTGATGAAGGAGSNFTKPLQQYGPKVANAAGSLLSPGGSAIGGLLGAGLGYLDAKNQPDSLTIKNEIDPRLGQYAYGANGTGGIAGAANNLMNTQMGQPNPMVQAGQQISGMANTLPNWGQLVDQAKGQWDPNPWIGQQQKAITDLTTRNLMENILPNIGSNFNSMNGYGGSRQGIAQGKSISDMNTNLAPALSNLASQAWESGQNRALSSAGQAGNYGLGNQAQQAGLLGTGAGMQMQAPWMPIQNATNVMRSLPGNTSQTQPLFNNPLANAIGGGSLGSQIGGGTDWGSIFKGIGGIGDWFKNWGGTA